MNEFDLFKKYYKYSKNIINYYIKKQGKIRVFSREYYMLNLVNIDVSQQVKCGLIASVRWISRYFDR